MEFLWFLSGLRVPALNSVMNTVSLLGTPFAVMGIILLIYWDFDKKLGRFMSFSFLSSCLICQGIKLVARVPRPWQLDPSFTPVEAALSTASGYSFPSVHSQSAASLGGSGFLYTKKTGVRVLCVAYVVLIAFSRMYLGVHTPADVATGLIAGLAVTALVWLAWKRLPALEKWNAISFLLIGLAVILLIQSVLVTRNGTVAFSEAKDSFETAGSAIGFALAVPLEKRTIGFSTEGTLAQRAARFLIGLALVLAIEFGLKALFADQVVMLVVRYALMTFVGGAVWPALFVRLGLAGREGMR